jgi:hypothetical protein
VVFAGAHDGAFDRRDERGDHCVDTVGNDDRLVSKLIFALVFIAALFIAFASAPVHSVTYVPTYAVLWIAFLVPFGLARRAVFWRCGTIAAALLALALIGVPSYLSATAMTSAREASSPPIFHPGWQLLSPAYWRDLIASFPVCSGDLQLMCPWARIGWLDMAILAGAIILVLTGPAAKRRYGLVVIVLLAAIHFYALLSVQEVLGRLHVKHAVSDVGVLSARSPGGNRGRGRRRGLGTRPRCKLDLDAGAGDVAVGDCRTARVDPHDPAVSAASARARAVRAPSDCARAGNQGSDRRLSAAGNRVAARGRFRGHASTFFGAPDGLAGSLLSGMYGANGQSVMTPLVDYCWGPWRLIAELRWSESSRDRICPRLQWRNQRR